MCSVPLPRVAKLDGFSIKMNTTNSTTAISKTPIPNFHIQDFFANDTLMEHLLNISSDMPGWNPYLPPPPNIIVLSSVYIVITALGLVGNGLVIAMIIRVLWSRRMVINVYVYVLCLSAVDFVFLVTAPMTITFMLHGNWTFGSTLCKIAFSSDGLNKTMSIYLLVILSADRYLAVCKPTTSARYRSVKAATIALVILFACVMITNIPIYKYATVTERAMDNESVIAYCAILFPKLNETGSDIDPWNHFGSYYTLILVICYYIIPAILICFFYVKILGRLKAQYTALKKKSSTNRRQKVTMSILSVIAFYFICWSPYWLLQMIIQFFPHVTNASEETQMAFLYLATSIYTLPYINSSMDPLLYAFLNKRLRKAYAATAKRMRRGESRKTAELTIEESQHSVRLYSLPKLPGLNRETITLTTTTTPKPSFAQKDDSDYRDEDDDSKEIQRALISNQHSNHKPIDKL